MEEKEIKDLIQEYKDKISELQGEKRKHLLSYGTAPLYVYNSIEIYEIVIHDLERLL
jgi:hypothetical protein